METHVTWSYTRVGLYMEIYGNTNFFKTSVLFVLLLPPPLFDDSRDTVLLALHRKHRKYTLREEILAGRNFGGFGGFVKNPPKSAKLTSRQN